MIMITLFVFWLLIGIVACKFNRCGDWLIMITDERNTSRTWLAVPTLILCWMFWPFAPWIARIMFLLSIV